jgi:hypothetical protein
VLKRFAQIVVSLLVLSAASAVYAQWTPGARITTQLHNLDSVGRVEVDPSAATSVLQGHFAPAGAVTTLTGTLDGWRNVHLASDAACTACVTFDASNPVTTSGGKCTRGTPLRAGESTSRDYGFPFPIKVAASCAMDAATGADISYEITK